MSEKMTSIISCIKILSLISVDASAVSKGQLEIDSDLPVRQYDKIGQNVYKVTIIPRKLGKHDMIIKYNGEIVEGTGQTCMISPTYET